MEVGQRDSSSCAQGGRRQEEGLGPSPIITGTIFRAQPSPHVTQQGPERGWEILRMASAPGSHAPAAWTQGHGQAGPAGSSRLRPLTASTQTGQPGALGRPGPPTAPSRCCGSTPKQSMENLMSEFQLPQRMWPDLHLPERRGPRGLAGSPPSLQGPRSP